MRSRRQKNLSSWKICNIETSEILAWNSNNCSFIRHWILTSKQEGKDYYKLIECMTQNVLHHRAWDERFISTIRFPKQERFSGGFSCQSQGSERIHYEVYPQHLHSLKRRILEKTGFLIDIHSYSETQQFSGSLCIQKLKEQNWTATLY